MNKPATSSARNASRVAVALLLLLVTGGGLWFWQRHQAAAAADGYRTAMVERGDIRVAISATGTLGAISTVDVGSQISGQVTSVLVDFNDHAPRASAAQSRNRGRDAASIGARPWRRSATRA